MRDNCPVSVVMCVYNGERYISEAIESIISQTFNDFEFIIVNDGSTDSTEKIVKSYNDTRIKYHCQNNQGASAARNFGIKISHGKYVAIMDADDICLEQRLEKQFDFLESNPGYILCGSNACYVDHKGYEICTMKVIEDWGLIKDMKFTNPFIHSTVCFLKKAGLEAGLYPEAIKVGEDHLFFLRLKNFGKMGNLSEPLIKYRVTPEGASHRDGSHKPIMKNIIYEYTQSGSIKKSDIDKLNKNISSLSARQKKHYYHLTIVKLLLFNVKKPFEVTKHLIEAAYYYPLSKLLIRLIVVSIIPFKYREELYQKLKHNLNR